MERPDPRRHWKLAAIGQEALLNFAASWPRSLVLVVLLGAVTVVPAIGEANAVDTNLDLVAQIEEEGGNVLVASSTGSGDDQTAVDSYACESLRESRSIIAGGPVGVLATRPLSGLSVQEATVAVASPGALDAMWPSHESTGFLDLVVPVEFATARGLYPGSSLYLGDRLATVSSVIDTSVRMPNRGTTILEVASLSHQPAAECLIETTWESRSTLAGSLLALLSRDGTSLQVLPLRSGGIFDRRPQQEHTERWSKHAWVWGSVAGGLLVLLVSLGRRAHIGLYRSLRMSRSEAALLISLETLVAVSAALSVAAVGLCIWSYASRLTTTALTYGLRSVVLTAAGTTLAATATASIATAGAIANQLKER